MPDEIAPLKNYETHRGRPSKQVIGFARGVDLLTWQLIAARRVHKSPLINDPVMSRSSSSKDHCYFRNDLLIPRPNLPRLFSTFRSSLHLSTIHQLGPPTFPTSFVIDLYVFNKTWIINSAQLQLSRSESLNFRSLCMYILRR